MKKLIVNYQEHHRGVIAEAKGFDREFGSEYTLKVQIRKFRIWHTQEKVCVKSLWTIAKLHHRLDKLWDKYIREYERKMQTREALSAR